jgi:outer membrane protein, multidrug efflux system
VWRRVFGGFSSEKLSSNPPRREAVSETQHHQSRLREIFAKRNGAAGQRALVQPIFAGGRIRSNVRFTEARQQEAALVYQQTIQQAFRGVSDALVGYSKDRGFREQQEQLTFSAQDAARLSETRYRGGATSYLEVLTNETNYFDAELGLAQAELNELVALVGIYRNLGGGWQEQ